MGADRQVVLDRATFADFASLFATAELGGIVEQWHEDSLGAVDAICAARADGDRARIGDVAHRAAGGGLALGALAFAQACERLRAVAESGGDVSDAEVDAVRAAVATTYAAMSGAAAELARRAE